MDDYKCKRCKYVTSLKDVQRICAIAGRFTLLMQTEKEYRYTGVGTLRYITYIQDNNKYYKITSKWVKDIEDKKGKTKYVDVFNVGETRYACTWIFDKRDGDKTKIYPSKVFEIINQVK